MLLTGVKILEILELMVNNFGAKQEYLLLKTSKKYRKIEKTKIVEKI